MPLPSLPPTSRCAHRLCQLVIVVSAASLPFNGRTAELASPVAPAAACPPHFPDELHVMNGCFISAVAYVARFSAAFPAERAQPLTVELKEFYGQHTITLLSWRGAWWGRDENFGVFPLDRRVASQPDPTQLVRRAEAVLSRHAKLEERAGRGKFSPRTPSSLSAAERARHASQAAAMLPGPSELFWVSNGREEIPVLFFRPFPGLICVYDPLTGTGQAESDCTNTPSLVKAFAEALGYKVTDLRADLTHPAGALAWREKSRAGL